MLNNEYSPPYYTLCTETFLNSTYLSQKNYVFINLSVYNVFMIDKKILKQAREEFNQYMELYRAAHKYDSRFNYNKKQLQAKEMRQMAKLSHNLSKKYKTYLPMGVLTGEVE